jgi:hypothetical protein
VIGLLELLDLLSECFVLVNEGREESTQMIASSQSECLQKQGIAFVVGIHHVMGLLTR